MTMDEDVLMERIEAMLAAIETLNNAAISVVTVIREDLAQTPVHTCAKCNKGIKGFVVTYQGQFFHHRCAYDLYGQYFS